MLRSWRLLLLALAIVFMPRGAWALDCPEGDLLAGLPSVEARGVTRPEALTDGWQTPEGAPALGPESSQMSGLRPFVSWDLGAPRRLRAAVVQADNNDSYRLLVSENGREFTPAWRIEPVPQPGLRERATTELDVTARFVRLEAARGDEVRAASEVKVFCAVPEPWPPPRLTRYLVEVPPAHTRYMQAISAKLAFGIAALFALFVGLPRLTRSRAKQAVLGAIALLSFVAWSNFFQFHPGGLRVHYSDVYHYYAGPKYFEETGYFEFYRCIASAERELGHGAAYDRELVRDLDDNRLYPGTWSRTPAGRCRAQFSPERWAAFKADIEAFRPFTEAQVPLVRAISDHGFNATPFHSAVLRLTTSQLPITSGTLNFMGFIDVVAFAVALGALWWGFGLEVCALAALLFGLGYHWGYNWIGGTMARHLWLAWACLSLALFRRKKPFWGAVTLTLAGLHRFFPFVFLGAVGLNVLISWARTRRLDAAGRAVLAGIAITLVLGVGLASAVHGPRAFVDHARVLQRHSSTPSGNLAGLPALLAYSPGQTTARELADFSLSDPTERWVKVIKERRRERAPIWIAAVFASLLFIGWTAYRRAELWESLVMGGALLYAMQDMTSYDYIWLLLLVPFAATKRGSVLALLGYALATVALALLVVDVEVNHVLYGPLLLAALLVVYVDAFRRFERRAAAPPAADPAGA